MKKILALILAAVMLFSIAACGSVYENYEKYIELNDLKKITIEESEINEKVDADILALLEKGRLEFWEKAPEDAVAQKGDKINIDFEYVKGTAVDYDNTAEDFELSEDTIKNMASAKGGYDLVLGSDSFIGEYKSEEHPERNTKGFEEQIIEKGAKAGDDAFTITVTFPDKYEDDESLEGVKVDFEIKVNAIYHSFIVEDEEDLKSFIVTLGYEFENTYPEKVEEPEASEGDTENPENTENTPAPAEESAGEGTETPDNETPDGETSEEETTEEEEEVDLHELFDSLFKAGTVKIDYSKTDDLGKYLIFDVKDVFEKLTAKTGLYHTIKLEVKVPAAEDLKDDAKKFEKFAGEVIPVTFTVNKITTLPELTVEYIKEKANAEYESVDAYKEELYNGYAYEMAYTAIVDAAVLKEIPEKEVKELYKSLVESYITNALNEQLGGSSTSGTSYSVGDFTQKKYNQYITDEIYKAAYEYAAEQALLAVKEQLVCEYLYDKLDISVSNKEYKEKIKEAYEPNKTAYKSLGINSKSEYVEYVYGGKDEAITALKYQKLSEKQTELVALITLNPAK